MSRGILRILKLRSLTGTAYQLCGFLNCFFSRETWTQGLTPWSFTAVFVVTVPDEVPSNEVQG